MLLSLLLAAAVPSPPACPIDRAVYRLHGAPAFTAGFARHDRRNAHASDLAFWVRTPLRTYWFSFGSANGYGGTFVSPALDPRRSAVMSDDALYDALDRLKAVEEPVSLGFHAFDTGLGAFPYPPGGDSPAPALIFVPDLGRTLWYSPVALAGGDETARKEAMPTGLFEPAGCDGPPP
ncbi:MAG TPA: hypothetical protein VEA61_10255 [Allosphingosinicella sp.]|nr:hypothetical protein [Allosphingosinicella sp.]